MLEYNALVAGISIHAGVIYGVYSFEASGDRSGSARKAVGLSIAIYTTFANVAYRFVNALGIAGFALQIPDLECRPE